MPFSESSRCAKLHSTNRINNKQLISQGLTMKKLNESQRVELLPEVKEIKNSSRSINF